MLKKLLFVVILGLITGSTGVVAQVTTSTAKNSPASVKGDGMTPEQRAAEISRRERIFSDGQENALRNLGDSEQPLDSTFQRSGRDAALLKRYTVEVPKAVRSATGVSSDSGNFARLINTNCNGGPVISVADASRCETALPIFGAGSHYSFRNKSNYNTYDNIWADIRLSDGKFLAGAPTVQGVLTILPESSLKNVSTKTAGVDFLSSLKFETNPDQFRRQQDQFTNGVKNGGLLYANRAEVKLNAVYVLRTAAFRGEFDQSADNRTELIIAFKVVEIEADGSVVIVWKQLKKSSAPRFES